MANIELCFPGRLFLSSKRGAFFVTKKASHFDDKNVYLERGKRRKFLLLRPNPLTNLRTTPEAKFTKKSFQMVLDQTRTVHVGPFHL